MRDYPVMRLCLCSLLHLLLVFFDVCIWALALWFLIMSEINKLSISFGLFCGLLVSQIIQTVHLPKGNFRCLPATCLSQNTVLLRENCGEQNAGLTVLLLR